MKGARVMGVGTLLANVTLLILSIMQFTQFICSHDHTALFAVTQLQLVSSICIGYTSVTSHEADCKSTLLRYVNFMTFCI